VRGVDRAHSTLSATVSNLQAATCSLDRTRVEIVGVRRIQRFYFYVYPFALSAFRRLPVLVSLLPASTLRALCTASTFRTTNVK